MKGGRLSSSLIAFLLLSFPLSHFDGAVHSTLDHAEQTAHPVYLFALNGEGQAIHFLMAIQAQAVSAPVLLRSAQPATHWWHHFALLCALVVASVARDSPARLIAAALWLV
jgi:hypothetical protein